MDEYIEREAAVMRLIQEECSAKNVQSIMELPAVSVPQWISIKDRLPEVETEVLVACDRNGYRFVCPAIYEDGTVLTQDSIWNWYELENYGTYSEENDDYFVPEGWWENRQFSRTIFTTARSIALLLTGCRFPNRRKEKRNDRRAETCVL